MEGRSLLRPSSPDDVQLQQEYEHRLEFIRRIITRIPSINPEEKYKLLRDFFIMWNEQDGFEQIDNCPPQTREATDAVLAGSGDAPSGGSSAGLSSSSSQASVAVSKAVSPASAMLPPVVSSGSAGEVDPASSSTGSGGGSLTEHLRQMAVELTVHIKRPELNHKLDDTDDVKK